MRFVELLAIAGFSHIYAARVQACTLRSARAPELLPLAMRGLLASFLCRMCEPSLSRSVLMTAPSATLE
ncbi:hypothetical protein AB1N83_004521 [Pleurotus pulmonarius]